jgi:hypothetical protein
MFLPRTVRLVKARGGGGLHTSTRSRRTSGTSTISIRTAPSRGGDKRSSTVIGQTRLPLVVNAGRRIQAHGTM